MALSNDEIQDILKRGYVSRFMTPCEQREQQISWVRGELILRYPTKDYDEVDKIARDAWRRVNIRLVHGGST